MRFKGVMFASALSGLAALGLVSSPAVRAAEASPTPLQLNSYYGVVADQAHGHVFVSPGSVYVQNDKEILVTNMAGKQVTAITGLSGASGMVLSPDGKTLYVALAGSDSVAAIDTSTLKVTTTYPLGAGDSPADIAFEDGKLWVSYYGNGGYIGEIDPAVTTSFTPQALPGSWYYAPQIAVDPLGKGVLVASDSGLSVDAVGSYNVSTTPPTVYDQPQNKSCGQEDAIAVVPGGSQFLMACNLNTSLVRYNTTTLAQLGTAYPVGGQASSVIVAPDGTVAVGLSGGAPDVFVFHPGAHTPVNVYNFNGTYTSPAPRGLAWSGGGSRLETVVQSIETAPFTYTVNTLNDPEVTASSLTLRGTYAAVLGKTVALNGKLTFTVGKPPAGTRITITRIQASTHATRHFTVTLAANDTYKLTDKPSALGGYTYTAYYAGSKTLQPATATRTVTILRFPVSLSLSANATSVDYKGNVTVTAHLGQTYTGRTVSIYAQPFGSKTKKLLRSGRVSSSGNLSVSYTPVYSTAFTAVFGGDARYAPKTVTRDVFVRASVSASQSGYFESTYIGGILYRVYHQTGTLVLHVTVAPNKQGECIQGMLEVYTQGTWVSAVSNCGYLTKSSTFTGPVSLAGGAGFDYRIRADYVRSGNDDKNLSNHSGWLYFEIVA